MAIGFSLWRQALGPQLSNRKQKQTFQHALETSKVSFSVFVIKVVFKYVLLVLKFTRIAGEGKYATTNFKWLSAATYESTITTCGRFEFLSFDFLFASLPLHVFLFMFCSQNFVVYHWSLCVVLLVAFYCCSNFVLLYHNLNNPIFSPACNPFWELMISSHTYVK